MAEVADLLKVSVYTIRKEIREERLPVVPFTGKVVRIPAWAVDALLSSAGR
jgi:excisionase family DNA binding protein